jgi:hypothetical protein
MIKIEKTEVLGWEAAIRGMRNPMNSWERSDSEFGDTPNIGEGDRKLMLSLAASGSDHAKYRRMIAVYVDLTAPLYWWKEFDTYKVGTVANSTSTMHKIHAKAFTREDFSCEHLTPRSLAVLDGLISELNAARDEYGAVKGEEKKNAWWQMIQLLPSSYNQKRTVMLNYQVLANIYGSRREHKLDEWREFCGWIEELPYEQIITNR